MGPGPLARCGAWHAQLATWFVPIIVGNGFGTLGTSIQVPTGIKRRDLVVIRQRAFLQLIKQRTELFVLRMPEVCLKAGEIGELDDGREREVFAHQLLIRSTMRRPLADAETLHVGNRSGGGFQRIEHFLPAVFGQAGPRAEQHDVNDH